MWRKLQIRSTKFETSTNDQDGERFEFRNLNFGFVSDFDIRISDLTERGW